MPTTYKILGQSSPNATTNTTLYTVPSLTQSVVSSIIVCNRSAQTISYRIAIRLSGASIANSHYICYDIPLLANSTDTYTLGITLAATDVVTVYASTGDVTFSLYGSEIT